MTFAALFVSEKREKEKSISRANDVRPYHSGSSGNYAMRSVGWRRRDRGGAFPKKASENFSEWQSAVKTREEKKKRAGFISRSQLLFSSIPEPFSVPHI